MEITPGIYRTRCGKRVTIHEIKLENGNGSISTFPVKGSIWKKEESIGTNPPYIEGRHSVLVESKYDLMERESV